MELGEILKVTDRIQWRSWLAKYHRTKTEIWLVYYRKETGRAHVEYNEAVEEALCFGWIDSTVKSINKEMYAQRFSPRKKTSTLSQPNIERIRRLIKQKKMTQAGLDAIAHVYTPEQDGKKGSLVVPSHIADALKATEGAWENFRKFPESYKRIRIAYIESRKQHGSEQHRRALRNFVAKTAQNKRIGIY